MMHFFKRYSTQLTVLFFLSLLVFLVFRSLPLPYFWDELGVYARSSLYLKDHGLSLLPGSCPPELSRGHPLLFSFIYGLSFSIFGDGIITGHLTSLFVSAVLLLTIFFISAKYFSNEAGLTAVIFLLVQPVFLAQSVLVLPEILLALFIMLSLFFWMEEKYIWFAFFSSCAIMTKETAVIIPVIAILGISVNGLMNKNFKFKFVYLTAFIPLVVFGAFLLTQNQQNGWYLFPLHENSIDFNFERFMLFLGDYCEFIFFDQWRSLISGFILFFIFFAFTRKEKLVLPPFLIYIFLLIIIGVLFSSFNFYMDRYAIFILVGISFLIGWMISEMDLNKYPLYRLGFGIIFFLIYTNRQDDIFDYDVDLDYTDYVELQQEAVDYAVSNLGADDSLFSNFPIVYSFTDSRLGYCDTTEIKFIKVVKADVHVADHFLIADPGSYDHQLPAGLTVMREFRNEVGVIMLMKRDMQ